MKMSIRRLTISGLILLSVFFLGCGGGENPVAPVQEQTPVEVTIPDNLLVKFPETLKISDVVQVEVVGEHKVQIKALYLSTWRSRPGFFYFTLSGSILNLSDSPVRLEKVVWQIRGKDVPIQAMRLPQVIDPGYELPFLIVTGDISESNRYEGYTFKIEYR